MKVNGKIVQLVVLVNFGMQMVTCMKVNGVKTKQMALESICMPMVLIILVIGLMICNVARVRNVGLMVPAFKVNTKKVKSMAKAHTSGQTGLLLQATGPTIK